MDLTHDPQRPKLRVLSSTLAIAAMLVLLASPAQAARASVKATIDNEWSPKTQRIEPGDYIVWKNPTEATHNIVAYGSNWSFDRWLYSGDTFTKRFRAKGVYKYLCSIHATKQDGRCEGMCGVIRAARI